MKYFFITIGLLTVLAAKTFKGTDKVTRMNLKGEIYEVVFDKMARIYHVPKSNQAQKCLAQALKARAQVEVVIDSDSGKIETCHAR